MPPLREPRSPHPAPLPGPEHYSGNSQINGQTAIDFWLKFIGVKKIQTLVVEGTTWLGKQKGEEAIARGREEAKKLAADF